MLDITTLACLGALATLTIALALWTSIQRGASKTIAYNAPLDPATGMAKAQRAHGNAAEYTGLLMALFLAVSLESKGVLSTLETWSMIAVTVARFIHALGFLTCKTLEKPHLFKAVGALVTYIGAMALAGTLVGAAMAKAGLI